MSSFALDVKRFAEKTKVKLEDAVRHIKIALFTGIIMDTRVDTGFLRGNWQTSDSAPIRSTIERWSKSGADAIGEVRENVSPFTVIYMTNNLAYAAVWEQRDAMIERNMARIARYVKEAVSNVR